MGYVWKLGEHLGSSEASHSAGFISQGQFLGWHSLPHTMSGGPSGRSGSGWGIYYDMSSYCHRDIPFHPDNEECHLPKCQRWCWQRQKGHTSHREPWGLSNAPGNLSAETSSAFQAGCPTLFCFSYVSRALPILGPQHRKPLPQIRTHEWVTDK